MRFHLYPEARLNIQLGLFGLQVEQAPLPTLINVMDLQQEQLARSLGEGHRVIHGAAGSGKTMILAYRCVHLAQTAEKPVLVLCYNRSLAGRLQQLLDQNGLQDKVIVRNFHAWCRQLLEAFQCPLPGRELRANAAMSFIVDNTSRCVEEGRIPSGQYAAVLIDEGHDFQPEWFKLVVPMVDPRGQFAADAV